jgi:hypothetical protein
MPGYQEYPQLVRADPTNYPSMKTSSDFHESRKRMKRMPPGPLKVVATPIELSGWVRVSDGLRLPLDDRGCTRHGSEFFPRLRKIALFLRTPPSYSLT